MVGTPEFTALHNLTQRSVRSEPFLAVVEGAPKWPPADDNLSHLG